jgi:hypothetical protein
MKTAAVVILALSIPFCGGHYRTAAEEHAIARAAATAYEAARAIEIGRAPAEPASVIKDCSSAIASAVDHPYPPPPALPPEPKP